MIVSFLIVSNLMLSIVVGMGIYSFSSSIVFAIIGAIVVTGTASANILFAFLAYPTLEYIFNGSFTIYSGLSVAINFIQLAVLLVIANKQQF